MPGAISLTLEQGGFRNADFNRRTRIVAPKLIFRRTISTQIAAQGSDVGDTRHLVCILPAAATLVEIQSMMITGSGSQETTLDLQSGNASTPFASVLGGPGELVYPDDSSNGFLDYTPGSTTEFAAGDVLLWDCGTSGGGSAPQGLIATVILDVHGRG